MSLSVTLPQLLPYLHKRRDIAEVFKVMTASQAEYSIQLMSRTLGVSRSGFYAHQSRPPSVRQLADDVLSDRIAAIHEASKQTYGAPRIHAELLGDGINAGRKRIERLMKGEPLERQWSERQWRTA